MVEKLLKRFNPAGSGKARTIKAFAYFKGGGVIDKIPRVLPPKGDVGIWKGAGGVVPVFYLLQEKGRVPEDEVYQVFNMGIGMVIIAAAAKADAVLRWLHAQGQRAWRIGDVVKGHGEVRVV